MPVLQIKPQKLSRYWFPVTLRQDVESFGYAPIRAIQLNSADSSVSATGYIDASGNSIHPDIVSFITLSGTVSAPDNPRVITYEYLKNNFAGYTTSTTFYASTISVDSSTLQATFNSLNGQVTESRTVSGPGGNNITLTAGDNGLTPPPPDRREPVGSGGSPDTVPLEGSGINLKECRTYDACITIVYLKCTSSKNAPLDIDGYPLPLSKHVSVSLYLANYKGCVEGTIQNYGTCPPTFQTVFDLYPNIHTSSSNPLHKECISNNYHGTTPISSNNKNTSTFSRKRNISGIEGGSSFSLFDRDMGALSISRRGSNQSVRMVPVNRMCCPGGKLTVFKYRINTSFSDNVPYGRYEQLSMGQGESYLSEFLEDPELPYDSGSERGNGVDTLEENLDRVVNSGQSLNGTTLFASATNGEANTLGDIVTQLTNELDDSIISSPDTDCVTTSIAYDLLNPTGSHPTNKTQELQDLINYLISQLGMDDCCGGSTG